MTNNMKINIGIDVRPLFVGPNRGIGKSIISLCKSLALLRPYWDFHLYYQSADVKTESPLPDLKNLIREKIDIKGDRFKAWEKIRLPLATLMNNVKLFHYPAQALLPEYSIACPMIVTIYDLIPLRLDTGLSQEKISSFKNVVERGIRRATKVIAISEYTKKDILDVFGSKYEDKIEVIYLAPAENCRTLQGHDMIKAVRDKYSIKHPYIFVFGYDILRKNIKNLMEGFAAFTSKIKDGAELVIAGTQDQFVEQLKDMARHYGIEDRVIFAGFVPEEDIPYLLSGAEFLMYVSLYEGFGLPPLDAMACDCPVIASNATSIPEVVGDAAILVDPYDTAEIADAMVNLFNDSALRRDLIAKGRERVKLFSWEKTAAETLNVYRQALGEASAV